VRAPAWALSEKGAGTALALGMVAALIGITSVMLIFTTREVEQSRLNALADNASVAAADALRGLVAGYPCDVARQIAPVSSCEIYGNDVLIEVSEGGLKARSRAGEPES
jgi:secretion/DNA translocation related TadE-like protein